MQQSIIQHVPLVIPSMPSLPSLPLVCSCTDYSPMVFIATFFHFPSVKLLIRSDERHSSEDVFLLPLSFHLSVMSFIQAMWNNLSSVARNKSIRFFSKVSVQRNKRKDGMNCSWGSKRSAVLTGVYSNTGALRIANRRDRSLLVLRPGVWREKEKMKIYQEFFFNIGTASNAEISLLLFFG